ncbi:MAG: hypothetical protein WCO66_03855, partial [Candidatus Absconditabacteria bacterium]
MEGIRIPLGLISNAKLAYKFQSSVGPLSISINVFSKGYKRIKACRTKINITEAVRKQLYFLTEM